jgi:hypothetical protein
VKLTLLTKILTGFGIIVGSLAAINQPSYAQDRFVCNEQQVSTTVQTERGTIPLIRWTNNSFPPPYTPTQRCQIVSKRFQQFDNNGTLKYIKADTMNNLPVLCVAAYKGGSCLPNGLLVTFTPGTDANQALLRLLDRRVWAAEGEVQFSGGTSDGKIVSEANGETYVNMEGFLNWADNPEPKAQ